VPERPSAGIAASFHTYVTGQERRRPAIDPPAVAWCDLSLGVEDGMRERKLNLLSLHVLPSSRSKPACRPGKPNHGWGGAPSRRP